MCRQTFSWFCAYAKTNTVTAHFHNRGRGWHVLRWPQRMQTPQDLGATTAELWERHLYSSIFKAFPSQTHPPSPALCSHVTQDASLILLSHGSHCSAWCRYPTSTVTKDLPKIGFLWRVLPSLSQWNWSFLHFLPWTREVERVVITVITVWAKSLQICLGPS